MLTLNEAIAHARKVAEEQRELFRLCPYPSQECNGADICKCLKNKHDGCIKCAKEHEQLAEWLEELKAYREIGTVEGYKNAIECYTKEYMIRKSNVQYDKAVDDFVHECDKHCEFYSGKNKNITREDILKIAEQLKEQNK